MPYVTRVYSSGGRWYYTQAADCTYPCEVVTQQWNSSFEVAQNAFNQTELFLFDLVNTSLQYLQVPEIAVSYPTISTAIPSIDKSGKPKLSDYNFDFNDPDPVGNISLDDVDPIDTSGAPSPFTKPAPVPVYGNEPEPLIATKPGNAPTVSTPSFNDAPDILYPDVPTIRELNLPEPPTIDALVFEGVIPENALVAPDIQFTWNEDDYSSALLSEINGKLLDSIQNGTTGLPAEIEDMLWQRARDRLVETSVAQKQEVLDQFASRGFDLPNGVIVDALIRVLENRYKAESDLNREVYIDQAKRAWDFMQFSIQTGVQLEGMLMDYSNQIQNRMFEAQKFTAAAALDIFNAKVEIFKTSLMTYQVQAEVFKIKVEAQLAELEKYKAQLDGQRLINELNKTDVEIYTAQLAGLQTQVEVYKAEITAESEKIRAEAITVDAFKSTVEAYIAQVQAWSTEWDAYKTRIQGEVAKIGGYEAEVNAYGARVQAYKNIIDARAIGQQGQIEANKARIMKFQADVDRASSQLQAETARLGAEASAFDSAVRGYAAGLSAEEAAVKAAAIKFEAEAQNAMNNVNLQLKKAEVEMTNAGNVAKALLTSYEMGAKVYSAIGSSAMATVSASASVSQTSGATVEQLTT